MRTAAWLGLLALAAAGCGSSDDAGPRSGPPVPSRPDAASDSGRPPSGTGGASGFGGSVAGTGGSPGGADAAPVDTFSPPEARPETGPSLDSAADVPAVTCAVTFPGFEPGARPVNVTASETTVFALEARASGVELPKPQMWVWKVTFLGQPLAHRIRDQDPARIEFPMQKDGPYDVEAMLLGTASPCVGRVRVIAILPGQARMDFLVRATSPAGQPLQIVEANLSVRTRQPAWQPLRFGDLEETFVRAEDQNGATLPAYFVRIWSPTVTARFEGYVTEKQTKGFPTLLVRNMAEYQVLIVPDGSVGGPRAPRLFEARVENLREVHFVLDDRHDVTGTIATASGPLPGARLRLRDGDLPSTVGESGANGGYHLKARAGQHEARVIPPAGSGLPEVQLPRSGGITISPGGLAGPVNFTYADRPSLRLTLTITRSDGSPPDRPIPVVLEATPEASQAELADVGRFELPGQPPLAAAGVVRVVREAVNGVATFERVPRARYHVILDPPPLLTGDNAITTVLLDLSAAGDTAAHTVAFGKRARIVGRLAPVASAAGRAVRAVDTAPDGIRRTVLAPVGADGQFELASDPGREYRLFVEPSAERGLPRIGHAETVRAGVGTVVIDMKIPEPNPIRGTVLSSSGMPVAGAVVQVFCRDNTPGCLHGGNTDVSTVLPVDETVSDAQGNYTLEVPDPGPL